jgi:uncharacterized protein YndB with AHSA1/START domain
MMLALYIVAALIVLLLIVIALQPAAFRIERSTTIAAPPSDVFARINDLHQMQDWSPWAKLDPDCKLTFSGPQAGTGCSYIWSGNSKVGEGTMTIIESRPSELVHARIDFRKPFSATNVAEFAIQPTGEGTRVTWSMTGRKNFIMKGFGLFMDMDKAIGKDFEKGLSQLKTLSESTAKGAA